jgi:hypothetical protein
MHWSSGIGDRGDNLWICSFIEIIALEKTKFPLHYSLQKYQERQRIYIKVLMKRMEEKEMLKKKEFSKKEESIGKLN